MVPTARTSLCPSRFCNGVNPAQSLVSKRQAELAGEPAIENAIRCSACGCVWVRDQRPKSHVLGTLKLEGSSCRWITAYKIPAA